MNRQYKAYDFKSGHTYLIGAFESKADAMAYCKTAGYRVIAQTVVALTDKEYEAALEHRIDCPAAGRVIPAERMEMTVTFKQEKVTKNTVKFTEVLENELDAPKIGTLYVQKATLKEMGWAEDKQLAVDINVQD